MEIPLRKVKISISPGVKIISFQPEVKGTCLSKKSHPEAYVATLPFWTGGSRFEKTTPVLPSSRFLLKSPVMRWSWLKCPISMNFSSHRLNVKILVASNKIRYACCSELPYSSWTVDPCQLKHKLFWYKPKKRHERVWESIQFVIFKPWKVLWTWIGYCWNSYCCFTLIFGKVFAKATQNSAF